MLTCDNNFAEEQTHQIVGIVAGSVGLGQQDGKDYIVGVGPVRRNLVQHFLATNRQSN